MPAFVGKAKHGAATICGDAIGAECSGEIILYLAKHLKWFGDLNGVAGETVVCAQCGDATDMQTGETRTAKINGDGTGLMGESPADFFARGHTQKASDELRREKLSLLKWAEAIRKNSVEEGIAACGGRRLSSLAHKFPRDVNRGPCISGITISPDIISKSLGNRRTADHDLGMGKTGGFKEADRFLHGRHGGREQSR
jgi:hypothetical protein